MPVNLSVNRLSADGMCDCFGLVAADLTEQKKHHEVILARKVRPREVGRKTATGARPARCRHQTLFSAGLIAEVLPRVWDQDQAEARRSLDT